MNLFVPLLKVVWKSKSTYLTSENDNIFQPFLIVPSCKGSLTIFFIVIYSFHTSPLGDISTPFVRGGNHFNDCLAQRFLTVLFKDFPFSISARGSWDTHHLWERLRKINGEFQSQSGRCQRINENFRLQERIKFLRSATLVGKRRWECLGTIRIKLKTKTITGKKGRNNQGKLRTKRLKYSLVGFTVSCCGDGWDGRVVPLRVIRLQEHLQR